jgi:hypothetical protein
MSREAATAIDAANCCRRFAAKESQLPDHNNRLYQRKQASPNAPLGEFRRSLVCDE